VNVAKARAALTVVVLAAGKGKRLHSKTIKLLHPVAGRPMVAHVLEAALALKPDRLVTVIGHQAERVRGALEGTPAIFALQKEQRGTGHAVLRAASKIACSKDSTMLILNGDHPTIQPSTLRKLVSRHRRSNAALSVLTAEVDDPSGYGRVIRDARGGLVRIVEHGDATPRERRVREINCGIYCARPDLLVRILKRLRPDNAQAEYYLTDAVAALLGREEKVTAVCHSDAEEILGVNTRQELARASMTLYSRKAEQLQNKGVTILDASRTWIDPRAVIGRDSIIYPDVLIEGATTMGQDCVVRSGCRLTDSRIGRGVQIKDHSVVTDSTIGDNAQVGPFTHLRPGSILETDSRVGNFVELKKTRLGRSSKANHLTYLGDATVGPRCNVGAGTITCNYDGLHKHPTTMGKKVFVGSNTQLVAPVKIGDGAYIAAGSTVNRDVPPGALAIARSKQRNIEGWVDDKKRRKKKG
jgi:bifunctional UDP-N-acetylglucosamine pyrophosphorylase/glucosamine-1-phosphate N-acetyltransferase